MLLKIGAIASSTLLPLVSKRSIDPWILLVKVLSLVKLAYNTSTSALSSAKAAFLATIVVVVWGQGRWYREKMILVHYKYICVIMICPKGKQWATGPDQNVEL